MNIANNQDWVLAQWRRDAAKDDPPFYTVREFFRGDRYIWLSIGGNVGWYWPEMKDEKLVGIRAMASPKPPKYDWSLMPKESPDEYRHLNWRFKLVSPKQRIKIEHALQQYGLTTI